MKLQHTSGDMLSTVQNYKAGRYRKRFDWMIVLVGIIAIVPLSLLYVLWRYWK